MRVPRYDRKIDARRSDTTHNDRPLSLAQSLFKSRQFGATGTEGLTAADRSGRSPPSLRNLHFYRKYSPHLESEDYEYVCDRHTEKISRIKEIIIKTVGKTFQKIVSYAKRWPLSGRFGLGRTILFRSAAVMRKQNSRA